jgi:hypothetical protein
VTVSNLSNTRTCAHLVELRLDLPLSFAPVRKRVLALGGCWHQGIARGRPVLRLMLVVAMMDGGRCDLHTWRERVFRRARIEKR